MLPTFFRTAWRAILHDKKYSFFNLLGLTIGMAVALLIGLWVQDQYRWDRFLGGFDNAFQVKTNRSNNGEIHTFSNSSMALWDVLRRDVPEVADVAPAFGPVSHMLSVGTKVFYPRGLVVGSEFLDVFGFPMAAGDPHTALKDVNGVVLTESMARALFGSTDVLNQSLMIDDSILRRVTAIVKDLPDHSSFRFAWLSVFDAADVHWKAALTDWGQDLCPLYVSLKPAVRYGQVEPGIRVLVKKYAPEVYRETQAQISMQPIRDWRLFTEYKNGKPSGGLIDYVRLFSLIGVLVLLIAGIGFVNLRTDRIEKRAEEVGIRNVIGRSRRALVLQFLCESLLLTVPAMVLSLGLVVLALPAFDVLTGTNIRIPWGNWNFWLILTGYALVTALAAGIRSASYLSTFVPGTLDGGGGGGGGNWPRMILLMVQFR